MSWKDPCRTKAVRNSPWSLADRLTAWYAVTSLLLISCTAALLYWALIVNLRRDDDLFLADKVHVLRTILRERPNDVSALKEEVELESAARRYEQFYVRLIDENGREKSSTPNMDALITPQLFSVAIPADAEPGPGREIQSPKGGRFWALAARATIDHSNRTWIIQIGVDETHDEILLAAYRKWLWMMLGAAVIICPLIGHRIATRGIRPVREITTMAERTGSQNLKTRIEPAGYPVELAALAQTFNAMLDRLEEAFERLSRFSADIAHELRTPVNNMRGEAEVILSRSRPPGEYREALASCLEESSRLSELIESLLFLARAESPGTHLTRETVRIDKELAAVRDYYEAVAAEGGITLAVEAVPEIPADLDRVLLQRAIGNLVENAITHTPSGGCIRLSARTDDGRVLIGVSDTGIGIPPQALTRVFDRFYRADTARSSQGGHMGLGLAIVRAVVELHGGTVNITSVVGQGTHVSLNLPLRGSHKAANSAGLR
jgi:two-component system, OmpR family, heavy metal sensor histidine kinase CusS